MTDRTEAYAKGMLNIAEAEGNPTEIADEFWRFAQALSANDELRNALSDPRIEASRRQQIVEDLLRGQANPATVGLVSMVVGAGRAAEISKVADKLNSMVATDSGREIALVRTATPISEDQRTRLAAALQQATGKDLDVKVTVDPSVVGGVVTEIGDVVLDGSIRSRLVQLREAF